MLGLPCMVLLGACSRLGSLSAAMIVVTDASIPTKKTVRGNVQTLLSLSFEYWIAESLQTRFYSASVGSRREWGLRQRVVMEVAFPGSEVLGRAGAGGAEPV